MGFPGTGAIRCELPNKVGPGKQEQQVLLTFEPCSPGTVSQVNEGEG